MLIKVYDFNERIKIDNIKEVVSKNLYDGKPIINNTNTIGIVDTKKTYICNDGLYVNAILYDIVKEDFQKKYKYEGTTYGGIYTNIRESIVQIFDVKKIKYLENSNE